VSAGPGFAAGQRVTIAVIGDSVVEGLSPDGPISPGLTEQLVMALVAKGFTRGGGGLQAATPFRWNFDDWGTPLEGPPTAARWLLTGGGGLPADNGPSGYSALALSGQRVARLNVRDQRLGILYTTAQESTPFMVTAGTRAWTLNAIAPGPPNPAVAWLALPSGVKGIRLTGPTSGRLILTGAIRRRILPARGVQVEVSNLGHAGRPPFTDYGPRARLAFTAQRYDVVVFLWSYLAEALSEGGSQARADDIARLYENALQERAGDARAHGSLCLIADSSPVPVAAALRARYSAINLKVARAVGCRWTGALRAVWGKRTPAQARTAGLVGSDDIHPTVVGYGRVARALTPALAALVRARARHPAAPVVDPLVTPTVP
jgi:hypothetical protein